MRIERVSSSSQNVSEKLRDLTGNLTWTSLFSRSKRIVRLKVRAEEIDFARAEVFIGDVNKKTKGAFAELTVEHLVHVLYADFLLHVRENLSEFKTSADAVTLEDTVNNLRIKRQTYFPRPKKSEAMSQIVNPKRWALLEVQFLRENVQRGEVFLYDAQTTFPDFHMELDEMISVLFVDFIAQLRRGNQQLLINALMERFFSHDFY
ncbi:hypothetical protein GZH47_31880 (plasmid) [Paenibacillus rhizovicinus]|uniref:Uncharacterized protein n=1 Tax=Paenibacillus rhizovicinus TaxID=2704463 RepID=A0A6C0PAN4_9BACL|nr:hypothetical protein [Paenibacillus rhizovicinus]QHW35496.1 hypothetical protein GZH47_31880 [Paenibacillus rhizovicinus]